jgi:hypothetical protein
MRQLQTNETCVKRLVREWPLVFVFGCIVFMLYPMLQADFAMIDDHEIVRILGRENRVTISALSPLIQQWAIEHNGRFRPGYYVLRILEAFVVGGHASLWYMNRLLLALVAALALYWGLRVMLRPFPAGVVTLLFFSGSQNEMWTRLGPQEAYAVPLVLAGLAWIAVQLKRHHWQPTRLFPGFAVLLLAGFVKESFVPVLSGVLVFLYIVMPLMLPSIVPGRSQFKRLDVLMLLLLVTGIGTQVWLTVRMLHTYGHQYSVEISLGSFLYEIKSTLERYAKDTLWFVPVVAGLAGLLPRNSQAGQEPRWRMDVLKATVLLAAGGCLILVPQWLVYGGTPLAGRYLTPGNLFVVFAAALGFYWCSGNVGGRGQAKLRGVVAGVLIAVALFRVFGTYREANAAVLSTRQFQATLAEIVALKTQHPELPLLFYSASVFDREPLVSVASFLAARLPNPEQPFLNPFDWETGADSLRKRRLANLLRGESLEGDKFFAKISDFRGSNGQCIAVIFSDFSEHVRCAYAVRIGAS